MSLQLSELQRERDLWVARNFPGDELVNSILGAMEELGELAHAFLKHKQGIREVSDGNVKDLIEDAVADCVIFLAGVATHTGFDYGEAVQRTWDKVKQRDWVNNPETGAPS